MTENQNRDSRKGFRVVTVLWAIGVLLALPFVLLAIGWLEVTIFGTGYVMEAYRVVGLDEPIQTLYDALAGSR